MKLFSRPKNESELVAVFDLGSSSVGGALFWFRKNDGPKIIYSTREPIPFKKELKFEDFLTGTLASLDKVAQKISTAGLGGPGKFFCVLASPWYSSQVRVISLKKEVPFIFNLKLADELIKKESVLFEEEYIRSMPDEQKVRPIELKNMRTVLNGYATSMPLDQKAQELEMDVFVSMSPEQVLSGVEDTIEKHFHRREVKFSSFSLASFTVARDMFIHQDNFLLVDIGGELTEICSIRKDALRASISFPFGSNYFIRGVASFLRCSLDEAESYISLYKDSHLGGSLEKKIIKVIEKLKADWLMRFQESLVFLSNDIVVSSTIFLTTKEDLAAFFADTIKNEQFNQYAFTESKFRVVYLGSQMLHGIAEYDRDVKHDSFITIESIYINRFLI